MHSSPPSPASAVQEIGVRIDEEHLAQSIGFREHDEILTPQAPSPRRTPNSQGHRVLIPSQDFKYHVVVTIVEDMTPTGLEATSIAPLQLLRFDIPAVCNDDYLTTTSSPSVSAFANNPSSNSASVLATTVEGTLACEASCGKSASRLGEASGTHGERARDRGAIASRSCWKAARGVVAFGNAMAR